METLTNYQTSVELDISWGVSTQPKRGQIICGDSFFVGRRGRALVIAVFDGLGSGPEAAEASQKAVSVKARKKVVPQGPEETKSNDPKWEPLFRQKRVK